MKTSSQMGQDKSEIPRQSLNSINGSGIADIYAGGSASQSLGHGQDRRNSSDQLSDNSPVAQWLMNEAKSRLNESMNKLGLDNQKINGRHLAAYSMDELQLEKKKVKNELKYYDQAF